MVLSGIAEPFAVSIAGSNRGLRRYGVPPGGSSDPFGAAYLHKTLGSDACVELWAYQDVLIKIEESGTVGIWGDAFTWRARGFRLRTPLHLHLEAGTLLEGKVCHPGACALLGSVGGLVPDETRFRSKEDTHRDTSHFEWIDPEPHVFPCFPYVRLPEGGLILQAQRDRIGSRLTGAVDERPAEGKSRLCTPGMIEAPSEKELLIVGPEGPTMGGYPFIGCLSRLGRSRLARLPVGAEIVLRPVTFEAAEVEWSQFLASLARHQARSGLE